MKKTNVYISLLRGTLVTFATILCCGSAVAQIGAFPQSRNASGAIQGYTLPRTVVTVTMMVEREVVLRGPYARFASQYLGISGASMSDKENYKIVDATLGYYEEPDPAQTYHMNQPVEQQSKVFNWLSVRSRAKSLLPDSDYKDATMGNNNPFTEVGVNPLQKTTMSQNGLASGDSFGTLPVNRTSAVEKSTEQMASEAADAIFTLRRRKFDLVTGEMGDNVFGAGLKDAIIEINRLEQEYLGLFIGKRYTQLIVKTFSVLPLDQNKGVVIACRFTPTKGIVSDTDLSGRPIIIEMIPEVGATTTAAGSSVSLKRGGASVNYRVPTVQIVKLVDGTDELARERIPIFQMGEIAAVPVVL